MNYALWGAKIILLNNILEFCNVITFIVSFCKGGVLVLLNIGNDGNGKIIYIKL